MGRQIYGPDRSKYMDGGPVLEFSLLGWASPECFLDRSSRVIYGPVYYNISPPIARKKTTYCERKTDFKLPFSTFNFNNYLWRDHICSIWASRSGPTLWWAGLGQSKLKYRPFQPIKKPDVVVAKAPEQG
jgi:hypothetical protein